MTFIMRVIILFTLLCIVYSKDNDFEAMRNRRTGIHKTYLRRRLIKNCSKKT